ncbi:MAG: RidA family protein [Gammaproteobacteria bacterium]
MTTRRNISSGSPLESVFGYSRAVRVGNQVFVSGSTAVQPDGSVAGPGDAYAQARAALVTIEKALQEAGATMADVVRTRVYLTNMGDLEAVAKAHVAYFGDVRPASTGVEVTALARPELIVEIEADAVVE